jgi:hypothetical protein
MKIRLPLAITTIILVLMVADYFVRVPLLNSLVRDLTKAILIMTACAVGIGVIRLVKLNVDRIAVRKTNRLESAITLISFAAFVIVGATLGQGNPNYAYMFNTVIVPLDSTMFALSGFFMASAAYRAFRARSKEASIMLLAGIIVMLGQAPVGEVLWPATPLLSQWVMDVPNTAGVRAMIMGIAIGMLSLTIRMITGHEKGYLASGE